MAVIRNTHINYSTLWACTVIIVCILWLKSLFYGQLVCFSFNYIRKKEIPKNVVGIVNSSKLQLCPPIFSHLNDDLNYQAAYDIIDKPLPQSEDDYKFSRQYSLQDGGFWQPPECVSRYNVVIIVPYRGREEQLRKFLRYLHPFLHRQKLSYWILIIEQNNTEPFNRGKLMNIGFVEGKRISPETACFIFHDVDLLPISDLNLYACTHNPRHMYSSLDTFRFHLPYINLFGGAVAFLGVHFQEVNGFSNLYFGWGGEDDDLAVRVRAKGIKFVRFDPKVAKYVMLPHVKETPSDNRFMYSFKKPENISDEGLSTLKYTKKSVSLLPLYTRVAVSW